MTEYVRVPVEPTDKMRVAGAEANLAHEQLFSTDGIFRSTRIYTAMLAAAASQDDELARLYYELLYAVEKKFPGESRHETALRYIRQCETAADSIEAGSTQAKG